MSQKRLNILIGFILLLSVCVNAFTRNSELNIGFSLRGHFWFMLAVVIYVFFVSNNFRDVFKRKFSIIFSTYFFLYLCYSVYLGNEYVFIKADIARILFLLSGIVIPYLITFRRKIIFERYIYIIFFFLLLSYYIYLKNFSGFHLRYSGYTIGFLHQLFLPVLFFGLSYNRLTNKSNRTNYLLLIIVFTYGAFFGKFRAVVLAIIIGLLFLINFNFRNDSKLFGSFINFSKSSFNFTIPILLVITLYYTFPNIIESDNYRVSVLESDNYRLFEAAYVFQEYIEPNLLFGRGFGTYFITPKGEIETDVHLGVFSLLLKFGLISVCLLLLLLSNYFIKYFIHSRSRKWLFKEPVLLLVPSLTIWFIYTVVAKGLFPESLFGLGLSIGLYLKNKALIKSAMYMPIQPILKSSPTAGPGTAYSIIRS